MIDPKTVPTMKLDGGRIPCVGMGTFGSDRVSPEEVAGAVAGGIRAGYRLFDCAACYGNEEQIGNVFRAAMDEGIEGKEQLADVVEVQSRRGFVEDEDGGLRLLHTEVIGKLDALVLATGQGG